MDIFGKKKLKKEIAGQIRACIEGYEGKRYRFKTDGIQVEVDGEITFVKNCDFDALIDRLNRLNLDLQK